MSPLAKRPVPLYTRPATDATDRSNRLLRPRRHRSTMPPPPESTVEQSSPPPAPSQRVSPPGAPRDVFACAAVETPQTAPPLGMPSIHASVRAVTARFTAHDAARDAVCAGTRDTHPRRRSGYRPPYAIARGHLPRHRRPCCRHVVRPAATAGPFVYDRSGSTPTSAVRTTRSWPSSARIVREASALRDTAVPSSSLPSM